VKHAQHQPGAEAATLFSCRHDDRVDVVHVVDDRDGAVREQASAISVGGDDDRVIAHADPEVEVDRLERLVRSLALIVDRPAVRVEHQVGQRRSVGVDDRARPHRRLGEGW